MEKSFIIAGFGGQGVMVAGQLLSYTACETTDKYVTYFPSYGAEMRGGTANCYVVISDEPVGAIIGYTEILPAENVLQTAFKKLGAKRPELNPINEAAFRRGWEIGHAAKEAEK